MEPVTIITGIMKNWDFLLPILVLAGIVITHLVKLVYGAFQPIHNMQVIILQKYKKRFPEFSELKAKLDELDKLAEREKLPNVYELRLSFPAFNAFVDHIEGKYHMKIVELMIAFPTMKELLIVEDDSYYVCWSKVRDLFVSLFPREKLSEFDINESDIEIMQHRVGTHIGTKGWHVLPSFPH